MLERHSEALEWYRSVPGGEARWTARLREANVLHELDRAPEAYNALRGLQGDATVDEGTRRDAYLLEAELRGKDEQVAEELDVYARGLAAYPDDPAILYSRALTWERRDDIPRAEADFRRILVAEPDNVTALNALGYTLADRTTRFAEALELIDRARAAEPDSAAIIDSYGWVLYRLGRKEEALVELRRAFSMQKDPEIASHLGEVLWVMGHKDEARRYFDEAKQARSGKSLAQARAGDDRRMKMLRSLHRDDRHRVVGVRVGRRRAKPCRRSPARPMRTRTRANPPLCGACRRGRCPGAWRCRTARTAAAAASSGSRMGERSTLRSARRSRGRAGASRAARARRCWKAWRAVRAAGRMPGSSCSRPRAGAFRWTRLSDWLRRRRIAGSGRTHYGADGRVDRIDEPDGSSTYADWREVERRWNCPAAIEATQGEARVRLVVDDWSLGAQAQ